MIYDLVAEPEPPNHGTRLMSIPGGSPLERDLLLVNKQIKQEYQSALRDCIKKDPRSRLGVVFGSELADCIRGFVSPSLRSNALMPLQNKLLETTSIFRNLGFWIDLEFMLSSRVRVFAKELDAMLAVLRGHIEAQPEPFYIHFKDGRLYSRPYPDDRFRHQELLLQPWYGVLRSWLGKLRADVRFVWQIDSMVESANARFILDNVRALCGEYGLKECRRCRRLERSPRAQYEYEYVHVEDS